MTETDPVAEETLSAATYSEASVQLVAITAVKSNLLPRVNNTPWCLLGFNVGMGI